MVELQAKLKAIAFRFATSTVSVADEMGAGVGASGEECPADAQPSSDLTSLHPLPLPFLWLASYRFLFHISLPPPL